MRVRLRFIQKDLFCTSLSVAENNYLPKFLFKLHYFIDPQSTTGKQTSPNVGDDKAQL